MSVFVLSAKPRLGCAHRSCVQIKEDYKLIYTWAMSTVWSRAMIFGLLEGDFFGLLTRTLIF
ncbi:hypothetical protein BC937DRAFT_94701 [Endogone sp. FLAS-F59071]|nr:hypothetical protein BC937DRAFT_94701 [Endogone sp. FLAS-F59071]|eukprot:RUS20648.1 hypothetical protein BC937DRAFT_94701 [Endogone sp. FLAS-F59071]